MIVYKIDILQALKEAGYNSTYIRKHNLIGQATLQKIRSNNTSINVETLDQLCKLLGCKPGDLIDYEPD